MATTTTSSNWNGFFNLRSTATIESRIVKDSSLSSRRSNGCGKPNGVATWFINGVTTAFFACLEHCSCIRIATEEDVEDSNHLPLIHHDGNLRRRDNGGAVASRRRKVKGKKNVS